MLSRITFIAMKITATGIDPTTKQRVLSFMWRGIYELLGGSLGILFYLVGILYFVR